MIESGTSAPLLSLGSGWQALLVLKDRKVAAALRESLSLSGISTEIIPTSEQLFLKVEEFDPGIILYEFEIPGSESFQTINRLTITYPRASIIVLSSRFSNEESLEAIKRGAADYIDSSLPLSEIILCIQKSIARTKFRGDSELLKTQVSRRYSFANIISQNSAMREIFETIQKITDYKTTVLICGESGTGKELIAKAIHYNSIRKNRRFVAINCGAIPENLLESELFGHKKGAFTDALRDKKGLFEEAEGGSVFLDEIGELPVHLQVKILRVLQENEIRPVGDSRIIPIDVRVIAATLRDLEQDVLEGRFRDDLYYRLNVITIRIPPLRERRDDIPILINHFLKRNQDRLGLPVYGISREAMSALIDHDWPGNIRELENCIERAMILTDAQEITLQSLPKSVLQKENSGKSPYLPGDVNDLSIKKHSELLERSLIAKALAQTRGNRTHAAKLLEISHRTLLYKLKEYQLVEPKDEETI